LGADFCAHGDVFLPEDVEAVVVVGDAVHCLCFACVLLVFCLFCWRGNCI
jgi:hypothetical protein